MVRCHKFEIVRINAQVLLPFEIPYFDLSLSLSLSLNEREMVYNMVIPLQPNDFYSLHVSTSQNPNKTTFLVI
jgi:hypothetical protein